MLKKFLILTLKGLVYRPIRSWLTVLGIVIGIMLVVIILALGAGIQRVITNTLQMFGSNLIVIYPGEETNPFISLLGGQKFKEKDLLDLEKIEGVKFVVPMEFATVNVEYKGEKKTIMLHAANWENYVKILELVQGIKLEKGNWPKSDSTREIIIGNKVANTLFKEKIAVGDEIIIKSKRYKVAGFMLEIGEQMLDNVSFISMEQFRELTGFKTGAATAFVRLENGVDIDFVAKQIRFQLSKQEVVSDFSILTSDKANRLVEDVLSIVELILVVIALISLVVGAVGIMNTMYTSVLERTRQIGIMKAVGASSDGILSLFLIESGVLGIIGGVLGIVFGILAAYVINLIAASFGIRGLFSFSALDFFGFFIILLITFVTGVIAGALPAQKAAKMEPAEALRYE